MKKGYAFYLKMIDKELKKSMDQLLEPYDLTKAQMDILFFLHKHSSEMIIQKDIENFYRISNATVTGLLNRMEAKGLIIREENPNDKRTKYIKETEKALEIHTIVENRIRANEEKIVEGFTAEEKECLQGFLNRIIYNLSQKEETHD